tara:strand:- start:902 stop:1003 length:102 start_codon:yes stop_codon:yes gene_type:complete
METIIIAIGYALAVTVAMGLILGSIVTILGWIT